MAELRISTEHADIDFDVVHRFLSTQAYWCPGIPRDVVERAAANSLCFSALLDGRQVGYARVLGDRATFAYLADVFVLPEHRGRGISKALMDTIMAHPELQKLRRFMPVGDFKNLSDADTAALVAHLQMLPSSDHAPAPFEIRPLGRVLYAIGKLELVPAEDIDHAPRVRISPVQGPNADYGAYLAQTCTGCHGQDFAGQRVPGTPPELPEAANLTPHATGLQGWSEADFVKVIRQGVRPDGRELHGFMPWKVYAAMTDDELRAIWLHLASLPEKPGTGKGSPAQSR